MLIICWWLILMANTKFKFNRLVNIFLCNSCRKLPSSICELQSVHHLRIKQKIHNEEVFVSSTYTTHKSMLCCSVSSVC